MPSSVVLWMCYERERRSVLIQFRAGSLYRYFDVPAEAWMAFRAATSKGTHLNTIFKDGGYGFALVDAPHSADMSKTRLRAHELDFWQGAAAES